ncbi:MAG: RNA ligase (ATP) [Treponema sp.]|jgi:RNA ligase (TIGR02306 family)|nr:RNA ligase (ATP) [Treponema sp.]
MRSLVTIQKVRAVSQIPESDFLELAHVMGWQCVAKKGEFKEGDLGVYFEVDSFLPIDERYEFLRASSFRDNADNGQGFRIKTMRMRGQLSQGLLLPLEKFPELADFQEDCLQEGCLKEGFDVTEKLNVKKWYIPETSNPGGTIIGERPYGIPASDEIRIQSALELLGELKGKPYYITTKMDGTSGIVYFIDGKIGCCSRNKEIKDEEDALYWLPVYKYGLKEKFARLYSEAKLHSEARLHGDTMPGRNIVLTGEICGPGIQRNKLRLGAIEWYVFDVKDVDTNRYLSYDDAAALCAGLGLQTVPLEERGEAFDYSLDTLLEKARGKYPGGLDKEGIVVRSSASPKAISFKVLNNDALLKEKD